MYQKDESHEFNPEGIRVLAVDANIVCLTYLIAVLKKCKYEATGTTDAAEALKTLRDNRGKFDIVMTDVVGQDMDGFKLLEVIGLEMDLPVIMVSADDSKSNIMRGIEHGARDYLLKPVRVQEIKTMWQHVFRKKMKGNEKSSITRETSEENQAPSDRLEFETKGTETEAKNTETGASSPSSSRAKKPRVAWTPELHRKFLDALQKLGEDAYPKKILDTMNEPGLTRDNVASHLQKYKSMLKKQRDGQQSDSSSVLNIYETRNRSIRRPVPEMNNHISPPSLPQFKDFNFSSYVRNMAFPNEYTRAAPYGYTNYIEAGARANQFYTLPLASCSNSPSQAMMDYASSGMHLISEFPSNFGLCQNSFPGQQEMPRTSINLQEGGNSNGWYAAFHPNNNNNLHPPEIPQMESSMHQYSSSSIDEELSAIFKEFSDNGPPQL